jgi:hypothetical protein
VAEGRRYARTLYQMAYKFMKLNYPDYNWRTKFGAFNCGAFAFPEAYRLDCLEKLAVKEGLDKAQTRWQFQQVFPHMKRLYRERDDNRIRLSARPCQGIALGSVSSERCTRIRDDRCHVDFATPSSTRSGCCC